MADLVNEIISDEARKQLDDTTSKLNEISKQITDLAKQGKTIQFGFQSAQFSQVDEVMAKAATNTSKMTSATQSLTASLKEAQAIIAVNNGHSNELVTVGLKVAMTHKEEAAAAKLNAEQMKINAEYAKRLTQEKERLDKAAAKAAVTAAKESNEYEQLKKQYKATADEAKRLGIAEGENSANFKKASAEAMKMYDALLKVEKSVGQAQRQVGQYNTATMAMTQILREAPAFAYNFNTGLMAISNNLPILIDEITKLKAVNADLVAAGGKAIPIWKTLGGAIFSFNGIATLALAAYTIFSARMQMSAGAMSEAEKAAKKYNDALEQINENATNSANQEMAHAKVLVSVAQDVTQSYKIRERAVKQLQETYPDYLGNISKEKILTGDLTKEMNALNEALMNRALMQAAEKKVGEAAEKNLRLVNSLTKAQKELAEAETNRAQAAVAAQAMTGEKEDAALRGGTAMAAEFAVSRAKQNIIDIQKNIQATRAEMNDFINQSKQFAKGAGFLALDDPDKAKKSRKGKDLTNESLKAEQDLTKEIYAEYARRLEIEAAYQKAIADDEKAGMNERVIAYRQYSVLTTKAKALALSAEYDETQQALDKISGIEKKSADKRTNEEKGLLLKKDVLLQKQQTIVAEYDLLQVKSTEETQKAITKIYEDEVKYRLSALDKIQQNSNAQMDAELRDLQQHYGQSAMSTQAFQQKQKEIKEKYAIQTEQDQLAYLKDYLDEQTKSGLDTTKITQDIASHEDKLRDAQSAKELDAINLRKNAQEKLKQEMINFAQEAAAAITQIQDQAYEHEISQLQRKQDAINLQAEQQRNVINATYANDVERRNELSKLEAQTAAQTGTIEEQKKAIERRKAEFDKKANIARITGSIAAAEAEALVLLSNPITAAYYPAIAATIAATGAVQLAVAMNAPIPAYKEGTEKNLSGTHPGGPFIAGDGGEPEYIKAPGKQGYWSKSASTLYNEAAGTTVTPLSKFIQGHAVHSDISLIQLDNGKHFKRMTDDLGQKIEEQTEAFAFIIQRNRPNNRPDNSVANELRKQRYLQ